MSPAIIRCERPRPCLYRSASLCATLVSGPSIAHSPVMGVPKSIGPPHRAVDRLVPLDQGSALIPAHGVHDRLLRYDDDIARPHHATAEITDGAASGAGAVKLLLIRHDSRLHHKM